ncbi:hypothetical protein [Facklamia miroungae]|uniref:Uncharacterized protein n=1 Tax=Facklamia miroungae TaxID=120956 RepID=A0A1G7SWM0_9LACT|nr:hypothetical protein [Facklamia miroungae]NKZ29508.1 hypothetical protein [Facklamia miroungae]SDG27371.1 hypothetical protein SAMN05421791_104189 [Facklamia miroungae]
MEDYLTAQEFADELEVTRQLIYYHAKKIPKEEKVYNKENKLVFTKEQQYLLKSFMTDTFDTQTDHEAEMTKQKNQTNIADKSDKVDDLEHLTEIKRDFTYDPELARQISLVLENERDSSNSPLSENIKDPETIKAKNAIEKEENEKTKEELYSMEHIEAIRSYIENTVKTQLKEKWFKDEEERKILVNELNEKNKQINDLLQLVDQQQQLMLLTEKKNNHLLETIDKLQMDSGLNQTIYKSNDKNTDSINSLKSKTWLQRLFS